MAPQNRTAHSRTNRNNSFSPLREDDNPPPNQNNDNQSSTTSTSATNASGMTDSELLRDLCSTLQGFRLDFNQQSESIDDLRKNFHDFKQETEAKHKSFEERFSTDHQSSNKDNTQTSTDPSEPSNVTPRQDSPNNSDNSNDPDSRQNMNASESYTKTHGDERRKSHSHVNNENDHNMNRSGSPAGVKSPPNQYHANATTQSTSSVPRGTTHPSGPPPPRQFGYPPNNQGCHSNVHPNSAGLPNQHAGSFQPPGYNQTHIPMGTPAPPPPAIPLGQGRPPPPVPPLHRNNRPHNFTPPTGIVIFDRTSWTNSTKHSTCANDKYETVQVWYEDIRGCMSLSTGHKNVLPDLNSLHPFYDFAATILPPMHQNNFNWAKEEFDAMSSALRVYFFRANIFNEKCEKILLQRDINSSETCGFILLLKLLGSIFPHMGRMPENINDKIALLQICQNDTYDSFYKKFIQIEKEVSLSLHKVSNTVVIEKFMELLMTVPEIVPRLSSTLVDLNNHIEIYGPNVNFKYSIHDVYKTLRKSGIATSSVIPCQHKQVSNGPQAYHASVHMKPQAHAAIVDSSEQEIYPSVEARQAGTLVPRHNRCPVCYMRHDPIRCWMRGEEFKPMWLRRNIVKYNALHKDDKPDPKLINAEPPLRQATVKNYKRPVTRQALVSDNTFLELIDTTTLDNYDYEIQDPDTIINYNPNDNDRSTLVTKTKQVNKSEAQPVHSVLNTGPAQTVFDIKPKTSMAQVSLASQPSTVTNVKPKCSMADVSKASIAPPLVNPFGNPFESEIFFDTEDGLVEY